MASNLNFGINISAIDNFSQTFKSIDNSMNTVKTSTNALSGDVQRMTENLRTAFVGTTQNMQGFRDKQIEVRHGFLELTKSTSEYTGKTKEFMGAIKTLGVSQKKITDGMMAQNDSMKMNFLQSIGTIMARSTQSEKIAANFERMGNPLYSVNNGLLKVSGALEGIARNGSPAVLALKQLGPNASMKELNDQVRLINQGIMRMGMVAIAAGATFVLAMGAIIDRAYEVNKALEPLTKDMKSEWATVWDPLAEVVGKVLEGVIKFVTGVGDLINRFNEAHPLAAKMIQSFVLLTIGLTALLSPLAIGIGLFGGIQAAMFAAWAIIGPLVVGLASVVGTAALVAGGIVLLVTAFVLAYQKLDWFREMVDVAWLRIKLAFDAALTYIKSYVVQAMNAISWFFGAKLAEIKQFWSEHGSQIMGYVKLYLGMVKANIEIVMGVIKGIFQAVWPIISGVVKIAWNVIKLAISNALDVVLGVISVALKLLKGDWKGAWNEIKEIGMNIMNNIMQFFKDVDLVQIGKDIIQGLINGIGSMVSAVTNKVKEVAGGIKDAVKDALNIHSPSRVMMELGTFVGQGLSLGIDKSQLGVMKAATGLAGAAVPSVSRVQPISSGGSSGGNVYIEVNGEVIDEMAFERFVEKIDRRLGAKLGGTF